MFLAQRPKNLSTGFRIESMFGLDYRHQAIATTDAPRVLRENIIAGLGPLLPGANPPDVQVHLAAAGTSSLDYAVTVDLPGDAAPNARDLRLALARIFVDTCNEQGWVIPFPQITVHPAGASPA
jgi:hypothetical protein